MPANRRSIPVLVALATVLVLGATLALLPRGSALEAEGATSGVVTATPDVAGLNVERVSVELSAPTEPSGLAIGRQSDSGGPEPTVFS